MKAPGEKEWNANRAWLERMAEAEDRCESVSVGGLASDLGMLHPVRREFDLAFGRLIEFARRAKNLSTAQLAEKAEVDVEELSTLERGFGWKPEPRTVYQLAVVLKLPYGKLQVLSGLAEPRDESLTRAAVRFAAQAEPRVKLSQKEQFVYEEFVKVIVEQAQKG